MVVSSPRRLVVSQRASPLVCPYVVSIIASVPYSPSPSLCWRSYILLRSVLDSTVCSDVYYRTTIAVHLPHCTKDTTNTMNGHLRRQAPVLRPSNPEDLSHQARSNFGNFILKPGTKARIYGPSWSQTETVVRPYPSLSYDDPSSFEPYRFDVGNTNRHGNWLRRYDCAWKVGIRERSCTFLIPVPPSGFYDPAKTPLGVLYNAVDRACKDPRLIHEHPTFPTLFNRQEKGGPPLAWIKQVFLCQGMLLVHNSKLAYGMMEDGQVRSPLGTEDQDSLVFMIPGGSPRGQSDSAGKTLLRLLNEERPGYRGPLDDFEKRYVCGDPVALQHGRFLVFREAGSHPVNSHVRRAGQEAVAAAPVGWRGASSQAQQSGGRGQQFKGYDVEVVDCALSDGTTPRMDRPEDADDVRRHWLYWEDVLFEPTEIEQAHMLNDAFNPDEIVYAFANHNPDWVKDQTWKAYRGSVSVQALTPPLGDAHRPVPGGATQDQTRSQGWRQARPSAIDPTSISAAAVSQPGTRVEHGPPLVTGSPGGQERLVDFPPRDHELDRPASRQPFRSGRAGTDAVVPTMPPPPPSPSATAGAAAAADVTDDPIADLARLAASLDHYDGTGRR